MKRLLLATIIGSLTLLNNAVSAGGLAEEAALRDINPVCQSHLEQVENSYNLNGLNLTFFHPEEASAYPSFHTSTEKFENGASFFATSLSPDGEMCYISIIKTTIVNNQSCANILQARMENDETLKVTNYGDGDYIHLYPASGAYQMLLVDIGVNACAITETRMMWPGA
ncbi:MAG TPA: hypothetical protein EYG22_02665 [Candidatus Thioglobus sp.]|nr:hypothetical protein [Candidatus Thioglobus sp.]HIL20495.1 hypothetical protein [Candidatus Thioglobus sp.]